MATALGDLVVNLVAKTGNAVKGIGQVSKMLKTMGPAGAVAGTALDVATGAARLLGKTLAGIGRIAMRVGKTIIGAFIAVPKLIWRGVRAVSRFAAIVAGIGGAGGLAGFGFLVRGQMKSLDATAKLSDRVGIATERLAGLRHAAEITGAGTEALDKGLMFMSKSLGEATTGVGEAKDALKLLQLPIADLVAMSPDQAIRTIADAMRELPTEAQKSFVAMRLFGRGGMPLVNMLNLGTEGLDKMQSEIERLGGAFSRLDLAKVERANDAIQRMKAAISAVVGRVAVAIAPFIEKYADSVTSRVPAIVATIKRIGEIATGVWNHVASGFRRLWNWIASSMAPFQDNFRSAFQNVMENLNVMLGSWGGFKAGLINITTQTVGAIKGIWEELKHWFVRFWAKLSAQVEEWWEGQKAWGTPDKEQRMADARLRIQSELYDKLSTEETRHQKAINKIRNSQEEAAKRWQNQMGELPTLLDAINQVSGPTAMARIGGMPEFAGAAGGTAGRAQYSAAMERGSAAAQRTIYEAQRGTTIADQQLKEARKQTTHLGNIEDAIEADEVVSIPAA